MGNAPLRACASYSSAAFVGLLHRSARKHIRAFDGRRLPPDDWHIVRSIVLERDGYVCTYCGADKQLEGDHILPLSRGGSNALNNLTTACRACNLSKGPKTAKEWRARIIPA